MKTKTALCLARLLTTLIAAAIALTVLAGCSGTASDPHSGDPVGTSRPETPDGTHGDSERGPGFNEGVVKYEIQNVEKKIDAFDIDALKTVVEKDAAGTEILFDADFSKTDDASAEGDAVTRDAGAVAVVADRLYIPFSGDEKNPKGSSWTTWAPKDEVFSEDYFGTQISIDGELFTNDASPWTSLFVGLYKENVGTIADNPTDGMYLAFNPKAGMITVYCADADNWSWPAGNCTVKVEKSLFAGDSHIDIVALENKNVSVYVNSRPALKVIFGEDLSSFEVLDGTGKSVSQGVCDPELIAGGYMSFFAHIGGIALSRLTVTGMSKGRTATEKTVVATAEEGHSLGLDITDKKDVVSICYSIWFDAINGGGSGPIRDVTDVSKMLEEYEFTTEKGFVSRTTGEAYNRLTKFHYWAEPAKGYYRSSDVSAIRDNMNLLYKAGVDFIILDITYATSPAYAPGTEPWNSYIQSSVEPLLDTIMLMRAEGYGTPYVVFWMGSDNMFDHMDRHFLSVEKWQDCFVYWDGKPLMLNWELDNTVQYDKWTVRGMYGLRGKVSEGQWSYLEVDNAATVSCDGSGAPEHICVDVATQETYMSLPSAHGRNGGRFFNAQWQNAFKIHPKIVTVTWWNEWCAQLYQVDGVGFIFTDNFNPEYSRDIEPVKGFHGDLYYRWLCEYIRAYRAGEKCPELVE
ncbi:MAG: hypothetical protein ILO53_04570 [Clostridia bacterium]|nr:hypothetical protein [Clostridia bacterium]